MSSYDLIVIGSGPAGEGGAGKFDFEEEFNNKFFLNDGQLQEYVAEYETNIPKSKEVCDTMLNFFASHYWLSNYII
jgi:hypothetical protein